MWEKRHSRTTAKEKKRSREHRQRKQILQFLGVGFFLFFAGFYVGTLFERSAAEGQGPGASVAQAGWQLSQSANPGEKQESADDFPDSAQEEITVPESAQNLPSDGEEGQESGSDREENLPEDWNLLLVNGTHTMPEDFTVELAAIGSGHQLDARIVDEFKEMIRAARADGVTIYVTSSYRTMEKQVELHQNKIEEYVMEGYSYREAQELAATVVAVPGTSEHQLGLAVDLVSSEYRKLDEKQENTRGFQWLKEHSWEHGFILRYPVGSTEITGIIYEPWHFRYVGKEAAEEITKKGITLEEYVGAV